MFCAAPLKLTPYLLGALRALHLWQVAAKSSSDLPPDVEVMSLYAV
jgi:hypothetical protein